MSKRMPLSRKISLGLLATVLLVAVPAGAAFADEDHGLVGAWIFVDPATNFTALNTFNREGTMSSVASPPTVVGGEGVWSKVEDGEFRAKFFTLHRNPGPTPGTLVISTKKHVAQIKLVGDDHATFSEVVENCDAAGKNCVPVPGVQMRTGTRIELGND
jgi:hypothetical protein